MFCFSRRWAVFSAMILTLAGMGTARPAAGEPLSDLVSRQIESLLAPVSSASSSLGPARIQSRDDLLRFYRERGFDPAWVSEQGVSPQVRSLVSALRAVSRDGLDAKKYHLAEIEQLLTLEEDYRRYEIIYDPLRMAQLDLLLSDAFMALASHLTAGQVDPNTVHEGEWKARPRRADMVQMLHFSLQNHRIREALDDMIPPYRGYRLLREALERYRLIAAVGGWPEIAAGPVLRPGDRDPRVAQLRQRLWLVGDLVTLPQGSDAHFDGETSAALAAFQARHGLAPDGVLGPNSLRELNYTVEERIRQVELNLERWRWLPKDLGRRYILVNIADFRLQVVENDRVVMSMPVVVGTSYRKTPVFSGRMTYLEFAPFWGVPETILKEDKLPKIRANPGFVAAHHYEIVPWSGPEWARVNPWKIDWRKVDAENFPGLLRQKPGPWNPLGQVKFMFPNEFDVYLHDTSEPHLFTQRTRSFSSGCIRIERPADLAQYLLAGDDEWDCDRLLQLLNAPTPRQVRLKNPVPVHLLYWTAWVDAAGRVHFRNDFYERDADLDLALRHREKMQQVAAAATR